MTTEPLFHHDAYMHEAHGCVIAHTPEGGIVLDKSVFYATSGGQPGDSGQISWEDKRILIGTAIKLQGENIVLVPAEPTPMPPVGTIVLQKINWDRRLRIMRVHTALHLLSAIIPQPVTGGQIWADRGRLDFQMPEPHAGMASLNSAINALIGHDYAITDSWSSAEELLVNPEITQTQSIKPPLSQNRVRLIRIGNNDMMINLQPCGGTHVARTAEVGRIEITRIERKSRMNHRITLALAD